MSFDLIKWMEKTIPIVQEVLATLKKEATERDTDKDGSYQSIWRNASWRCATESAIKKYKLKKESPSTPSLKHAIVRKPREKS